MLQIGGRKNERNHINNQTGKAGSTINLLPKVRVEVVVEDSKVEQIILDVREKVATGHVGDGKIFIRNIEEAIRIRTGERGEKAL